MNINSLESFYKNKRVLLTGAAGTVGREIAKILVSFKTKEIILMDNNESEIFFLMEEFKGENVNCFLGDIRDRDKVEKLSRDVDIIIHAAAFKHVILSEYNPFDVVQTNIVGVENIIRAATTCKVKRVLFTSSDKAVNPTNVMGASKLMGEKLITAANSVRSDTNTIFSSTRFGNIIGSRGSVVPLFVRQIRNGGPVTVTDRRMTRFIMTSEEASRLVLKSVILARGGEVFVTKMPVVKIIDLAEIMIELLAPQFGYSPSDIEIVEIGVKAGEKMYEELMSEEETRRSIELKDMFVVTPAFKSIYQSIKYEYPETISHEIKKSYNSGNERPMTKEELKEFFINNKILERILQNNPN
jgi:FlaA1/EpsC-like NDP-sugar epimerase